MTALTLGKRSTAVAISALPTTMISDTASQHAKAATVCRMTGCPRSGTSSLLKPMRLLLPAATMMAEHMAGTSISEKRFN
jgi:hypothetical protein